MRIRAFSSSSNSSSLRNLLPLSLMPSLSGKNWGDSDVGKIVIELAKERKLLTISIIGNKPGTPETTEELKALGGDMVVPESYTKAWYMKRVVSEMNPSAGINFSDGYQATAVGKALVTYKFQ